MTDFKVGDRVKVEFEGKKYENVGFSFHMVQDKYGNRYDLPVDHLTLIERAKPKLEAGQVWEAESGIRREITEIRKGKLSCWVDEIPKCVDDGYFWGCSVEHFLEFFAHKLITEGENG